uniref:Uncharacterized protein LOC114341517 n=1 Tax=Diabrotica virgifera virgifera TaxID=50390 RepID=A0A6P7GS58_DIAVI
MKNETKTSSSIIGFKYCLEKNTFNFLRHLYYIIMIKMSNRARLLLNMASNKNRISRSNAVNPDNLLHNNTDKLSDNFYSKSTPSQEDMQNLCSEPSTYTTNTDDKLHSYRTPQLSPQRTEDESEIDDSDNDSDFKVTHPKKRRLVVPAIVRRSASSSTSTSSSSSSCASDCTECLNNQNSLPAENVSRAEQEDGANVSDTNPLSETVVQFSEQTSPVQDKICKKRRKQPQKWKSNVSKALRNSGQAYQSMSKSKKYISERKVRPPCGVKCRLGCTLKIDECVRHGLFDKFWKLKDLQLQREFVVRCSQPIRSKYRYSCTQNLRKLNTAFFFDINYQRVRVCKTFFKSTLDLNNKQIYTAISKKNNTGFVDKDLRGRHGKQPTIDPVVRECMHKFISNIPRVESHHLRAQTSREYIHCDLSLADLYRDFKSQQENNNLPFASLTTFSRVFNNEYNISFYVPKKDQCDLHERYFDSF